MASPIQLTSANFDGSSAANGLVDVPTILIAALGGPDVPADRKRFLTALLFQTSDPVDGATVNYQRVSDGQEFLVKTYTFDPLLPFTIAEPRCFLVPEGFRFVFRTINQTGAGDLVLDWREEFSPP